ncbi:MAG: chaperonin GroEL [Erysipelothrix sp.]|nr:chaperonin GroEL [Erysipelothrix sp.]
MVKEVVHGKESRDLLIKGVDTLANVVKVTLGPKGRNVVLEKSYGAPLITNDGVTIAGEIELENKFENMGAKLLYEVANKTNDTAGDGTTTATILAQSIIHEGVEAVEKGANPVLMRSGIEKAAKEIAEHLLQQSKKIESAEDIANVAAISASNTDIGKIIAEAMDKVGRDGVITVDESNDFETTLEVVEGMQYDKGYLSPLMASDREKMETTLEDAYVLVCDYKLTSMQELVPLLEQILQAKRPLLMIAEDFDNEVTTNLIVNKLRGTLNVVATKAPSFGDNQKEILQDIATLTGATYFTKEFGKDIKEATIEDLGKAGKVIVKKDDTTIIDGAADEASLTQRIDLIKAQINNTESDYDRKRLNERLGKMTNGVAIIKVGANTEVELKEKKLRIEDALNATKAAVAEGIVEGGGLALIKAYVALKSTLEADNQDEQKGINAVFESIKKPLYQIAENAGFDGREIVNIQLGDLTKGFDAKLGEWKDLFKSGIVDPTKVTRMALLNASSIASMFLTTEAAVASLPEQDKPQLPDMPMY